MTPSGRYLRYEYLPEENILHLGYREVLLKDAQEVAEAWEETSALLTRYAEQGGPLWLIVCFDGIDFTDEGAEAFFQHVAGFYTRHRGVVRYTSGRVRQDKRFSILSETNRRRIRSNLYPSKEEALRELRRLIAAASGLGQPS
jgi:hypothetical protein